MNKNNTSSAKPGTEAPPTAAREPGFLGEFLGSFKTSIIATLVLAVIVSGVYPLIVWGFAQVMFHNKANGSLIGKDGQPVSKDEDAVGSALLAQGFAKPEYFHPRTSNNSFDGTNSGGSNLGPTSAKLMFGTTKDAPFTVIAYDPAHAGAANPAGRIEATFVASTATTVTVSTTPASGGAAVNASYPLDPSVAITAQGRTLSKTKPAKDAIVELKFNSATPPLVTAVTVIDKVVEGDVSAVNKDTSKITLPGDPGKSSTDYAIPSSAVVIVNGNAAAQFTDIPVGIHVRLVIATVMDFDGLSDRVVHYCEDNNIDYTSSPDQSTYKDADGLDDVKLINAFKDSTNPPTISPDPKKPIPADAVTASASGLDPHISPANAERQAERVALARTKDQDKASDPDKAKVLDKVKSLVIQYTEGPSLGFLGDAGVNVLRLNLALDKELPVPAAPAAAPALSPATAPAPIPTTAPTTAPATAPTTRP